MPRKPKPAIGSKELEFRLSDWMTEFSLDRYELFGVSLMGPDGICMGELVRQAAGLNQPGHPSVPCDVFVMGYGPPPRRDMTLVGGLPYRPAGQPWPISRKTGRELTFVCQFRTAESKDLFTTIPGEMLLLFAEGPEDWNQCGDVDEPYCEWQSLNIPDAELVKAAPPPGFNVPQCYGVRCRYADLLSEEAVDRAFDVLRELPRVTRDPHFDPADARRRQYVRGWVCQIGMIKVGGVPTVREPVSAIHGNQCCGTFIAQIPPVFADALCRWSWINCKTEAQFRKYEESNSLLWMYDATVAIFMDAAGRTVARRLL